MEAHSLRRDLFWSLAIALTIGGLLLAVEFTEWWYDVTRRYEAWELDELVGLVIGLLIGCLWFARRRIRAVKAEVEKRRAAEAKNLEQQELLRSILDHAPVEIFIKSLEGRIIQANRLEEELFGDRCGGVVGKTAHDIFPEDCARMVEQHDRDVLEAREALTQEYEIPMDDGLHTFLAVKFPIHDPSGEIIQIGGVVADITDRKNSEREMRLAMEQAERASASKSRFLAAASHDLRQPLQALSLLAAGLSETQLSAGQDEMLEAMQSAVHSMGSMLSALLDMSQLDAGVIEPRKVGFEIGPLLEKARKDFCIQAKDRGIELRCVPSALTVCSDPHLLERILANFLSNALNYTQHGRVLIGCRRTAEGLRLEVWDSGIGIAEQDLEQIFEEYYQVGNPARDRRRGLGLGLALVKRLARLLDHRLSVRSQPDKGSMFGIEVPHGECQPERQAARPRPIAKEAEAGTVLIIDDDAEVLQAAAHVVETWGYRAVSAKCATEALRVFGNLRCSPDLIIADFWLPEGNDGLDAIAEIRRDLGADIPAVIITGDISDEVAKAVRAAGHDVLHKPISPRELQALLRSRLSLRRPAAQAV